MRQDKAVGQLGLAVPRGQAHDPQGHALQLDHGSHVRGGRADIAVSRWPLPAAICLRPPPLPAWRSIWRWCLFFGYLCVSYDSVTCTFVKWKFRLHAVLS